MTPTMRDLGIDQLNAEQRLSLLGEIAPKRPRDWQIRAEPGPSGFEGESLGARPKAVFPASPVASPVQRIPAPANGKNLRHFAEND
jgi:hypothetical protein